MTPTTTPEPALFELAEFEEKRPADTLPCGHSIHAIAHYDECLNATCPTCHIVERNGYAVLHEHDPEQRARRGELCLMQSWHWERVASCLGCANWTFGTWPCRNSLCPFSNPDTPADPTLWQPHPTYQTWWYPLPYYPPQRPGVMMPEQPPTTHPLSPVASAPAPGCRATPPIGESSVCEPDDSKPQPGAALHPEHPAQTATPHTTTGSETP